MKWLVIWGLFLSSRTLFAEVKIAFIEIHDHNGKLVQLEPGGRFSHIAVSYKGKWLHAHPYRGVELIDTKALETFGTLTVVSLPDFAELSAEELGPYLGKSYDRSFSWDAEGFYCSELVGKILALAPEPMGFQAGIWQNKKPGGLGLSPDDIFRQVLTPPYRGKILAPRCETSIADSLTP